MCSFYNSITINWKQVFSDECDDTNIKAKDSEITLLFYRAIQGMGLANRLVIYKIKFNDNKINKKRPQIRNNQHISFFRPHT